MSHKDVTLIGRFFPLPLSRRFDLISRESETPAWTRSGTIHKSIETEQLCALAGFDVYATLKGDLLIGVEEYDYQEEYYEAEVSLYGKCDGCSQSGAAVVIWDDGLCSSCRELERYEAGEDDGEWDEEEDDIPF